MFVSPWRNIMNEEVLKLFGCDKYVIVFMVVISM